MTTWEEKQLERNKRFGTMDRKTMEVPIVILSLAMKFMYATKAKPSKPRALGRRFMLGVLVEQITKLTEEDWERIESLLLDSNTEGAKNYVIHRILKQA